MTKRIKLSTMDAALRLSGHFDDNLNLLQTEFAVTAAIRDDGVEFAGEQADKAAAVAEQILALAARGETVDRGKIKYLIELCKEDKLSEIGALSGDAVTYTYRGRPVRCKTLGQKAYVGAIRQNTVVIGVGPAGTGKTYLAVALAAAAFKNKEVERIVLTRPAVEAGEKLGFLPGDLQTKVDPYLRPLYDALQEMFGLEQYVKLTERQAIEVAPLAYMRGRTLSNCFVILDEAQNTTQEQMKMFLTRIGEGSRMVVNGDATQIDLPEGKKSGLIQAARILQGVEGIGVVHLSAKDVVRHELVQSIIKAYDKDGRAAAPVKRKSI